MKISNRVYLNQDHIGTRLRILGKTRAEVSEELGYSHSWLGKQSVARRMMDAKALAKILDCEVEDIILKDEAKPAEEPAKEPETPIVVNALTDDQLAAILSKMDEQIKVMRDIYAEQKELENARHAGEMNALDRIRKILADLFNLTKFGRTN